MSCVGLCWLLSMLTLYEGAGVECMHFYVGFTNLNIDLLVLVIFATLLASLYYF